MIPKILQLHWFWDSLGSWAEQNVAEWRARYEPLGWDVRLYDSVPSDLPPQYKEAMLRAPHSRFRADLVRYYLMQRDGGVYVDLDTRPGPKDLSDLLDADRVLMARIGAKPLADICVLGSRPGAPMWSEMLESCRSVETGPRPHWWFSHMNVMPDVADRDDVRVLAPEDVCWATTNEALSHCSGHREDVVESCYVKHYCNFTVRARENPELLLAEQVDDSFVRQTINSEPRRRKRQPPPLKHRFHTMPNGDLLATPRRGFPSPPVGFKPLDNDPYRFRRQPTE